MTLSYNKEKINHQYFRQTYKCLYYRFVLTCTSKPAYYSHNCYKGAYYASIILTKKCLYYAQNYASIIYTKPL